MKYKLNEKNSTPPEFLPPPKKRKGLKGGGGRVHETRTHKLVAYKVNTKFYLLN